MFGNRPRALVCYLCGREYGTRSLGIHLKTCKQRWIRENEAKPKKDRRPMPQPPKEIMNVLDKKTISDLDLNAFNEAANEEFVEAVLVHCPHCARTFSESAFAHHKKACTAANPMKARVVKKTENTRINVSQSTNQLNRTSKDFNSTAKSGTGNNAFRIKASQTGFNFKTLLGALASKVIKEEYPDLHNPTGKKKIVRLKDHNDVQSPYNAAPVKRPTLTVSKSTALPKMTEYNDE